MHTRAIHARSCDYRRKVSGLAVPKADHTRRSASIYKDLRVSTELRRVPTYRTLDTATFTVTAVANIYRCLLQELLWLAKVVQ